MCVASQDSSDGSAVMSKGAPGDAALFSFNCAASWSLKARSTCPFPSGNYSLFPAFIDAEAVFAMRLVSYVRISLKNCQVSHLGSSRMQNSLERCLVRDLRSLK